MAVAVVSGRLPHWWSDLLEVEIPLFDGSDYLEAGMVLFWCYDVHAWDRLVNTLLN